MRLKRAQKIEATLRRQLNAASGTGASAEGGAKQATDTGAAMDMVEESDDGNSSNAVNVGMEMEMEMAPAVNFFHSTLPVATLLTATVAIKKEVAALNTATNAVGGVASAANSAAHAVAVVDSVAAVAADAAQ